MPANADVDSGLGAARTLEVVGPATNDRTAAGLAPGERFSVSVTVTVRIPLLPEFVEPHTATGQFVVERDRYVDG